MNQNEIEELLGRAKRIHEKTKDKSGSGTSWTVKSSDGDVYYEFSNIATAEEIKDAAANAAVWAYGLKDHVKKKVAAKGQDPNKVEDFINNTPCLCICADIANTEKHGGLDKKSRSGQYPQLGTPSFSVPQSAIGFISIGSGYVNTDVSDPSLIEINLPVHSDKGINLGDIFRIIKDCLDAWEKFLPTI